MSVRIKDLPALAAVDIDPAVDVLAIEDISANITKKVAVDDLLSKAVRPLTITRVAPNGSDSDGARGGNPFLTIQAAINATQDGDIIEIAPQIQPNNFYPENIVIPPARTVVILRGSRFGTLINPVLGSAITWFPTGTSAFLELQDIEVLTQDPNPGIYALNMTASLATVASAVRTTNALFSSAVIQQFRSVIMQFSEVLTLLLLSDCRDATIKSCRLSGLTTISYDGATANLTRGIHRIVGSQLTGLFLAGQPFVRVEPSTNIDFNSTISGAVDGVFTTHLSPGRDYAPNVFIRGDITSNLSLTCDPIQGPPNARNIFNLSNTKLGNVVIGCSGVDPNATIQADVRGSSIGGLLTAGPSTTIDARGATAFGGFVSTAPTGTIDRSTGSVLGIPINLTTTHIPINPPLPLGSDYHVVWTSRFEDTVGGPNFSVGTKTNTGFDLVRIISTHTSDTVFTAFTLNSIAAGTYHIPPGHSTTTGLDISGFVVAVEGELKSLRVRHLSGGPPNAGLFVSYIVLVTPIVGPTVQVATTGNVPADANVNISTPTINHIVQVGDLVQVAIVLPAPLGDFLTDISATLAGTYALPATTAVDVTFIRP